MKKFASYLIYAILIACIACACSSDIDIRQDYEFKVTHLPVPKKVKKGEIIEIRCQLERSGRHDNASYNFRFFQFDGVGELKMDNGVVLLPNDYYDLNEETFRLYYKSMSSDAQSFNVYFFDNAGNSHTLLFSFNPDNSGEDLP